MRSESRNWIVVVAWWGAAGGAGCVVDLGLPSSQTQVSCDSTADCPEDHLCPAALGQCVPTSATGGPPPALVSVTVMPPVAGPGTVVTAMLEVDRPLAGDPTVRLDSTRALPDFVLQSRDGSNYVFTYLPTGREDEQATAVLIDAVDRVGTELNGTSIGSVTFDFTAPALSQVQATPTFVRAGQPVEVSFRADEALGQSPVVQLDDGTAFVEAAPVLAGLYRFELVPTGLELPEASRTVFIEVTDGLGNSARAPVLDAFTLDFTAPGLVFDALSYQPGPNNPLGVVARATAGTTIVVVAVADEPLDTTLTPQLTATLGSDTLTFTTVSHSATQARFEVTVPAGAADGTYTPLLVWTDRAGNASAIASFSAPIRVATSSPTLLVDQTEVAYLRSPWGNAASECRCPAGDPGCAPTDTTTCSGFLIPAGPYFGLAPGDALSAAATLAPQTFALSSPALISAVRVWADAGATALLGQLEPDGTGSWPRAQLPAVNTPSLVVTGIDDAGNASAPVALSFSEWVATSNALGVGGDHQLDRLERTVDAVTSVLVGRNPSEAAGVDAVAAEVRAGVTEWRERSVVQAPPSPPATGRHALAYDSRRGVVVLFGGDTPVYQQSTWEWDGLGWILKQPLNALPRARHAHQLAYDSKRGVVVLFGGRDVDNNLLQDTWEWNGVVWEERVSATPPPPGRRRFAMVFDSARAVTLLYGGDVGAGPPGQDTWEWDGTSWTERTVAGMTPGAREDHAMVFDSARGVAILYGGRDAGGAGVAEVWEWDGAGGIWSDVTPGMGLMPGALFSPAMAFDEERAVAVLFGGNDGMVEVQQTWGWNGAPAAWSLPTPPVTPGARRQHGMVYDRVRDEVVLFGGVNMATQLPDTWRWRGAPGIWTDASTLTPSPPPRSEHTMVYDPDRDRLVTFGGSTTVRTREMWEWDESSGSWADVTPMGTSPEAVDGAQLVYDTTNDRLILFGGFGNPTGYRHDTWTATWNSMGSTWVWTEETPAEPMPDPPWDANPPPRFLHEMVYDDDRDVVVVFGGLTATGPLADTWEGTDSSGSWVWTNITPVGANPSARYDHAMAYDSVRQRVVLFGGNGGGPPLADTWEGHWDSMGGTWVWTAITPAADVPAGRHSHAAVFDSARARVVMFGGRGSNSFFPVAWEWDGSAMTWSRLNPAGAVPDPRSDHTMAFDTTRNAVVIFAGDDSFISRRQDLWALRTDPDTQPAAQMTALAGSTGIPPDELRGLRVRAYCGADFAPYGPGDIGATLWGWSTGEAGGRAGAWIALANNDGIGSVGAPAVIDWPAPDAAAARRHLVVRPETLHFQCRPSGVAGLTAPSRVAVDYFEVRLRYGQ